ERVPAERVGPEQVFAARGRRGRAGADLVRRIRREEAAEDDHEQDDQADAEPDPPLRGGEDRAPSGRRPRLLGDDLGRDEVDRRGRHLAAAFRRGFRYATTRSATRLTTMNIAPISSAIASTLKASEVLVAWTRPCPMPGKA